MSPDLIPVDRDGVADIIAYGGSNESKIEEPTCNEAGAATIEGLGTGATSKESKIDDVITPEAGAGVGALVLEAHRMSQKLKTPSGQNMVPLQ